MVHRGVRSEKGELRRLLRKIIFKTSYHDQIMAETVCRLSRTELMTYAPEGFCVSDVPNVEKGEVLLSSRGDGSFQRIIK